jgi:PAS domain S-box-containing protein
MTCIKHLRRLLDGASDLLQIISPDGQFIHVNLAGCEALGYAQAELLGTAFLQVVQPIDRPRILAVLQAGQNGECDLAIPPAEELLRIGLLTKTGRVVPVSGQISYGFDGAAEIWCLWRLDPSPIDSGACQPAEIDRQQMEEAVYLREARYTLAVRAGQVGMWDWNLQTNYFFMDENYKEMLGFAECELDNDLQHWQALVHPDDFDRLMAVAAAHFAGHLPEYEVEYRMRHRDTSIRWFLARGVGIHDRYGKPFRLMGTHTDITARKQAEAALRESEERFRQIAESINSVFFIDSADLSQVLYISPAYEKIWGRTCDSVYQQPDSWLELVHPDDRAQVMATRVQRQQAEPTEVEFRIVRSNNAIRWIFFRSFPVFDEAGNLLRHVGLAEDISERKQAEESILEALSKEKELNELKTRFVSMISHEFRTPLTTIQLAAELLEYYEPSPDAKQFPRWGNRQHQHFQQIHTAVQHMTQLLEEVLLIGKTESGKMQFQPKPIDLGEFCQRLVADLQLTAGSQHVITYVSCGNPRSVWLDPKLLRQMLNNLLANAIKYSPQTREIRLELEYQPQKLVLRVRDMGIGIPAADCDRVFEAFYRATNVDTIQGTGLGLAIVKKCVDLHSGQIAVNSATGAGTTFTVTLPLNPL